MIVRYHPLVQRDVDRILDHLDKKAVAGSADGFYDELSALFRAAGAQPTRFHPFDARLRRANLDRFPYHFLYEIRAHDIYDWTVRHDSRHPRHGLGRLRR
jgi:plasmid stabilization system protein ParE